MSYIELTLLLDVQGSDDKEEIMDALDGLHDDFHTTIEGARWGALKVRFLGSATTLTMDGGNGS